MRVCCSERKLTFYLRSRRCAHVCIWFSDITIQNCYLHDAFMKAVNIQDGRYITIKDNLITNIGTLAMLGGHGVMRMWEMTYGNNDPDEPETYRIDITGNIFSGVEQRIYSFVSPPPRHVIATALA